MLIVTNVSNQCKFKELIPRDVFSMSLGAEVQYLMKINPEKVVEIDGVKVDKMFYTAVNLSNGDLMMITDECIVTPHKTAELRLY